MSLTESSTVTKSTVNPDAEVSSETSLSQNTYKEGMSGDTRDINLASDTEDENRARIQSTHLDFFATEASERNPQENEGLRLIVRVKSLRKEMMNICRLQKVSCSPKT